MMVSNEAPLPTSWYCRCMQLQQKPKSLTFKQLDGAIKTLDANGKKGAPFDGGEGEGCLLLERPALTETNPPSHLLPACLALLVCREHYP